MKEAASALNDGKNCLHPNYSRFVGHTSRGDAHHG